MGRETEHKEIDLRRLLSTLWSHLGIILIASVLTASMAFGYMFCFVTPQYAARTRMYVNNVYVDAPYVSSSQIAAAKDLAETYIVILKSRDMLMDIQKCSGLEYSASELNAMISAQTINKTEVFQVTVTCENYEHALIIADAVAQILPGRISEIMQGSTVEVVESAFGSVSPINRDFTGTTLLGALAGFAAAAFVFILLEILDTTIRTEDTLLQSYKDIPLLAVIPGDKTARYGAYKYYKGNYEMAQKRSGEAKSGGAL